MDSNFKKAIRKEVKEWLGATSQKESYTMVVNSVFKDIKNGYYPKLEGVHFFTKYQTKTLQRNLASIADCYYSNLKQVWE
jgi:hypothetical protein